MFKRGAGKKTAILCCLALLVASFACAPKPSGSANANANSAERAAIRPANQNASPPAAPQMTPPPAAPAYGSGGLGLDRADWERAHGEGKPDNTGGPMFFGYEGGKFQVRFSGVRAGNVKYVERVWGDRNAVTLEDARKESKQFIPADAKFVRTYTSQGGSTVDLYRSESLKGRFTSDDWTGGKPGDFIILYRNQTGRTTTFIAATGNNP